MSGKRVAPRAQQPQAAPATHWMAPFFEGAGISAAPTERKRKEKRRKSATPVLDQAAGAADTLDVVANARDAPGAYKDISEAVKKFAADPFKMGDLADLRAPLQGPAPKAPTDVLGNGLAVAGGALAGANHKAANRGTAAIGEKVAVGASNTAAALAMGPWGVVDYLTGGNVAGGAEAGAMALSALASGDFSEGGVADRAGQSILNGDKGRIAQGIGKVGEGLGTGFAMLISGETDLKDWTPDPTVQVDPELDRRMFAGVGPNAVTGWTDESASNARIKKRVMQNGGNEVLADVADAKASKAELAEAQAYRDAQQAALSGGIGGPKAGDAEFAKAMAADRAERLANQAKK